MIQIQLAFFVMLRGLERVHEQCQDRWKFGSFGELPKSLEITHFSVVCDEYSNPISLDVFQEPGDEISPDGCHNIDLLDPPMIRVKAVYGGYFLGPDGTISGLHVFIEGCSLSSSILTVIFASHKTLCHDVWTKICPKDLSR